MSIVRGGLLAVALFAATAPAAAERGPRADAAAAAAMVVDRTNDFRAAQGVGRLAVNGALVDAAQRFADFMAASDQYGHEADGRKPPERARAAGYDYCVVAENIAYQFSSIGFGTDELAARLVEGWQQSPGHRHNMLLPQVVEIGVGIARSPDSRRYYAVQMFGRPKSASVRFEIANRSEAPIRYELGAETHTLAPQATRTHEGCFTGTLTVLWPEGPPSPGFAPRDGARYVVQRDHAGLLRLRTAGR